jgi:hypothetical protein
MSRLLPWYLAPLACSGGELTAPTSWCGSGRCTPALGKRCCFRTQCGNGITADR